MKSGITLDFPIRGETATILRYLVATMMYWTLRLQKDTLVFVRCTTKIAIQQSWKTCKTSWSTANVQRCLPKTRRHSCTTYCCRKQVAGTICTPKQTLR